MKSNLSVGRTTCLSDMGDVISSMSMLYQDEISKIVENILDVSENYGNIFITGVGKSGNVAKQFSSFLATIGLNSQFLCPVSASHGEMAKVCKRDFLFVISWSAKTGEIQNILNRSFELDIRTAILCGSEALTNGRVNSKFKYKFILDEVNEVVEKFPLKSTVLTTMFCMVIVEEIIKQLGFTFEKFKHNHPGGFIGELSNEY